MDIRKFFGGGGGGKKPATGQSPNKKSTLQKPTNEKAKSKLSSFQRDREKEPIKKTDKSKGNGNNNKTNNTSPSKSSKTSGSRSESKTKSNGKDEGDSIVIEDCSDDDTDVIPCSLNSTQSTTPASKKGKSTSNSSSKKTEATVKKNETKSARSKDNNDKPVNGKHDDGNFESKKQEKAKKGKESELKKEDSVRSSPRKQQEKTKKGKESELKKEGSVRSSPRKQQYVGNGKQASSKKSKRVQISDDESDEVSIIKETSSEEDEDVAAPIKRRAGGNRKRGRKAANIFESDSEGEDPVPKKTPQSKRKKTGGVSFIEDSDEDEVEKPMDKFVKKKSASTTKTAPESAKKEAPKKLNVSVSDFFGTGSASASRVERPVVEKRKREEERGAGAKAELKSTTVFEEEMHDDEDFLKVLDELDGPDVKKVKLSQSEEEKTVKQEGSLASKLANKMKGSPVKIPSSPAKKAPSPHKPSTSTSIKQRKSYTLEVTHNKQSHPKPVSPVKTPPKATPTPSKPPVTSGKKNTDPEDDGFGTKKAGGFRAFKMRGGPLSLGSKEIPEGEENCMEGLTFVITGVLDSIERDDAKTMVEKYGGKVTTSLSKKTGYLVVGREPGESKLSKAKDLKVKQIDEDGLFELVKTLPGKTSKYEIQAKEQLKKENSQKAEKEKSTSLKKLQSFQSDKAKDTSSSTAKPLFTKLKSSDDKPSSSGKVKDEPNHQQQESSGKEMQSESLLWVDKHKPTMLKQIIGQQGDKSNAHKLLHWIKHWHTNVIVKGMKAAGNFFGKGGGDGAGFRAALLSGPPGIGKTTSATLVCKEAGFTYVELNASDTRSKKSLKEVIAESLNNQTLMDYIGDEKKKGHHQHSQHHCLIMDEVDGMAGNEDRGGLQELVQLIKNTKIPIICICNDRNSMKMRTLANHCFDLRFQRPRVEQIKGAMMTLAFREGIKIPPSAVQEIIQAANHDIRQVIHNLSMWTVGEKTLTFEQVKEDAQKAQKDLKMGPFDVCRKVFVSDEETRKMSIHDKSDLFFHDYSFAPLFVHENYPHIIPSRAEGKKSKHMACLAHTIDSLCDGDLVEKLIRNGGNWNLLPTQAMYSSVLPGEYMRGSFPQMTNFPSWLGKNSTRGKTDRILQELGMHMGLKISCDKRGLNQDYLPALRTCLTAPLASHGSDGVPGVIRTMEDYDIIKDDFDNILEVSKWPNSIDYMARVESKTKAALTRMYNKSGHVTPYSTGMGGKKKGKGRGGGGGGAGDEDLLREEGEEDGGGAAVESEEEDDEPVVVAKPKGKASKGKQDTGAKAKLKGGGKVRK